MKRASSEIVKPIDSDITEASDRYLDIVLPRAAPDLPSDNSPDSGIIRSRESDSFAITMDYRSKVLRAGLLKFEALSEVSRLSQNLEPMNERFLLAAVKNFGSTALMRSRQYTLLEFTSRGFQVRDISYRKTDTDDGSFLVRDYVVHQSPYQRFIPSQHLKAMSLIPFAEAGVTTEKALKALVYRLGDHPAQAKIETAVQNFLQSREE